jgi:hypothetical protein
VERIEETGLVSAWRQGKKEKLLGGNKREINGADAAQRLGGYHSRGVRTHQQ